MIRYPTYAIDPATGGREYVDGPLPDAAATIDGVRVVLASPGDDRRYAEMSWGSERLEEREVARDARPFSRTVWFRGDGARVGGREVGVLEAAEIALRPGMRNARGREVAGA